MAAEKSEASKMLEEILKNPKVRVRNSAEVLRKLDVLISGGVDRLMVISDFDYTITRYKDANGEQCWTTHGCFDNCAKLLSAELQQKFEVLKSKYLPVEFDPKMSIEEKIPFMEAWWRESHQYIMENKFNKKMIENSVRNSRVQMRDGAAEFLLEVCASGVPLVCFSAGLGNLIEIFLKSKFTKIPENFHIISNQMIFDQQEICVAFTQPLIHTFNKNATVVDKERPFFHSIRQRSNVLLLGDSLGDIHMDVGVEEKGECLRIGFLNFNLDQLYPKYFESYDLVLLDDQTFEIPAIIFQHIRHSIRQRDNN